MPVSTEQLGHRAVQCYYIIQCVVLKLLEENILGEKNENQKPLSLPADKLDNLPSRAGYIQTRNIKQLHREQYCVQWGEPDKKEVLGKIEAGCPSCSFITDRSEGTLIYVTHTL